MRIKIIGGKTPEFAVVDRKDVMEAAFELYKRNLTAIETYPLHKKTQHQETTEQRELALICLRAADNFFYSAKQYLEQQLIDEESQGGD